MTRIAFPSLEQFNRIHERETFPTRPRQAPWRAKIKLHGTNAAIRIAPDGTVTAQSRKQELTPEADLHGFAAWLAPARETWARAADEEVLTFFGEWAGKGIAKGCAVQQLETKRFYIFALGVGMAPHPQNLEITIPHWMITEPGAIAAALPEGLCPDTVRVLPWEDEAPLVFDFADPGAIAASLEILNRSVEALEGRDPYIARTFGVEGPGEGFVLVEPAGKPGELSGALYGRTSFKAKTEKHRVQKQGRAATPREPLPETAQEFIATFCTSARLEQAIDEVAGGRPDIRKTGAVIGWITTDIAKEAKPEIAALGMGFDRLKPAIADEVRRLYMARLDAA